MARQVGPGSGNSALSQALRARGGDKSPISESHQGQRQSLIQSPNVWLQSQPRLCCHELKARQTGGVHVCERTAAVKPPPTRSVLNTTMDRFQIIGPKRVVAFIAQISMSRVKLRYVREIWEPTPAQAHYEGRTDLGNTVATYGFKYRGRDLIQVTGASPLCSMQQRPRR